MSKKARVTKRRGQQLHALFHFPGAPRELIAELAALDHDHVETWSFFILSASFRVSGG